MNIRIRKSLPRGSVQVPPSKSMAHRLLICQGLSGGVGHINRLPDCDDVKATVGCLKALGAEIKQGDGDCEIRGIDVRKSHTGATLYANESGSTIRFFIPILLYLDGEIRISGAPSLMKRPMTVYEELFGDRIKREGDTLVIGGPLKGGEYRIRADVSSQFISGLLFALPLCEDDSTIILEGEFESRSYVLMTIAALGEYGVTVTMPDEKTLYIKGGQRYLPRDTEVEGDFSAGAFIEGLDLLYGGVRALGLRDDSLQGDKVYREYFGYLGDPGRVIDLRDCPDNAPVLFALAAMRGGAKFTGTRRLKIKESDRAQAMREELAKLGITVEVGENDVTVHSGVPHAPTEPISSHNDHRIAMAMAVCLVSLGGVICGAEAVKKSYPDFFSDIEKLGVRLEEVEIT